MATLSKPIVIRILPFDPNNDFTFTFLYSGEQIQKNRLVIKDNENNTIVYDETVSSMKLEHILTGGTLTSGKQYLAQIQVFNANGDSSMLSDAVLFYCLTTPTFAFTNIKNGDVYKNASITLELSYLQEDGEQLRSYQILQYTKDKMLINSSDTIYSTEISSYIFYNLENNFTYYFRAIGETVNGISLDTGYIEIDVVYKTMPANLAFKVENNYCEGYITLNSNIKNVEYEFENDSYVLEDGLLKLKNNSLIYKNSFDINRDFVLFIEAKKLPVKKFFTTNNDEISLIIMNICNAYYCKLAVKDSDLSLFVSLPNARLTTDENNILVTDDEKLIEIIDASYDDNALVVFEVKRKNGMYSLKAYYKAEYLNDEEEVT